MQLRVLGPALRMPAATKILYARVVGSAFGSAGPGGNVRKHVSFIQLWEGCVRTTRIVGLALRSGRGVVTSAVESVGGSTSGWTDGVDGGSTDGWTGGGEPEGIDWCELDLAIWSEEGRRVRTRARGSDPAPTTCLSECVWNVFQKRMAHCKPSFPPN